MTADKQRESVVDMILSRVGKNQYSQASDKRNLVGSGWGDCSSTVRWCYRQALGVDIGSNTVAQISNKALAVVEPNLGGQPNELNLKKGDLLYFEGTNSSRPEKVGHVEMYIGGGRICGHGSGKGPTTKNMKDYVSGRNKAGRRYIKALRVIVEDGEGGTVDPLFGARTLRRGSRGSDVMGMQSALISLGYSCGRYGADGDFGGDTESAVREFQRDESLAVDGIAGPKTFAALRQAVERAARDYPEDSPEPEAAGQVLVTGGSVRIRVQPTSGSAKIVTVSSGTRLPYLGATTTEGWHHVRYEGQEGWISGRYSEVVV